MVDKDQIKKLVRKYFDVTGQVSVDASGLVSVDGSVYMRRNITLPGHMLPVKFDRVSKGFRLMGYNYLRSLEGVPIEVGGDFDCASTQVGSLQHAPQHVGGNLDVRFCNLKNFVGGPQWVGGAYYARRNPITSLDGLPDRIPGEFDFEWYPELPVLKALVAKTVEARQATDVVEPVTIILNKYAGQGKPGALKAAAELIRAGFKGNARW